MFQSTFFAREFPGDNAAFEQVILTEPVDNDPERSLTYMRKRMLEGPYCCGIFIGGMSGVEEEYKLFRAAHPATPTFPIASTGAAAEAIFRRSRTLQKKHPELTTEISYITLMRSLIHSACP